MSRTRLRCCETTFVETTVHNFSHLGTVDPIFVLPLYRRLKSGYLWEKIEVQAKAKFQRNLTPAEFKTFLPTYSMQKDRLLESP